MPREAGRKCHLGRKTAMPLTLYMRVLIGNERSNYWVNMVLVQGYVQQIEDGITHNYQTACINAIIK